MIAYRMRENRIMLEQENQLNAPDPRESRPPCYEDAILLPRLDGSFASLNELNSKRLARRSTSTGSTEQLRNKNRCRSEEVNSQILLKLYISITNFTFTF